MYDRQTESWWQKFVGKAIVGEMTGTQLKRLPARIMPFAEFCKGYPDGLVLVPNYPHHLYGKNPYEEYDMSFRPYLYRGGYHGPSPALAYVVAVEGDAWPLKQVRDAGRIEFGDIVITWAGGMNSAPHKRHISNSRDIRFVTVRRRKTDGTLVDIPHNVTFAFAFQAFRPEGILHVK